jgi:hypothetical protein
VDVVLFPAALFSTPWRSGWKLNRAMEEKEVNQYAYRNSRHVISLLVPRVLFDDRWSAYSGSGHETRPVE